MLSAAIALSGFSADAASSIASPFRAFDFNLWAFIFNFDFLATVFAKAESAGPKIRMTWAR